MTPFQVWFKHAAPEALGFSIRDNVPFGFGALQLRPSVATGAIVPSGHVHNLSVADVASSVLLYWTEGSPQASWRQVALWQDCGPPPNQLPTGEWCLFTLRGQSLHPARPLDGWPLPSMRVPEPVAASTKLPPPTGPSHDPVLPAAGLEQLPVSAVRHLRPINPRLLKENQQLQERISGLERQLC